MYEVYVKKKITDGLKAADEGHVVSHDEAKKRLLQMKLEWTEPAVLDLENIRDISRKIPRMCVNCGSAAQ